MRSGEDFSLTTDKESPQAVLSLCIDGIEKIGPTTFEMKRADFDADIRFVVFDFIDTTSGE